MNRQIITQNLVLSFIGLLLAALFLQTGVLVWVDASEAGHLLALRAWSGAATVPMAEARWDAPLLMALKSLLAHDLDRAAWWLRGASAINAVGALALLWWSVRRHFDLTTAWLSVVVLGSSFGWLVFAKLAVAGSWAMFSSVAVAAAAMAWAATPSATTRLALVAGVAWAVASAGLYGLGLAAVLGAMGRFGRRGTGEFFALAGAGILLAAGATGAVLAAHPTQASALWQWLFVQWGTHAASVGGETGLPTLYLGRLTALLLPWFAFVGAAIYQALRQSWKPSAQTPHLHLWAGWLAGSWLIWELVPGKSAAVVAGALPAVSVWIALVIKELNTGKARYEGFVKAMSVVEVVGVFFAAFLVLLWGWYLGQGAGMRSAMGLVTPLWVLSIASVVTMYLKQPLALVWVGMLKGLLTGLLALQIGSGWYAQAGNAGTAIARWLDAVGVQKVSVAVQDLAAHPSIRLYLGAGDRAVFITPASVKVARSDQMPLLLDDVVYRQCTNKGAFQQDSLRLNALAGGKGKTFWLLRSPTH